MNSAAMSVPEPRSVQTLDRLNLALLLGFVAALQISIALSQILLAALLVSWIAQRVQERTRPAVPPFFIPLALYGGLTLVASVFSVDPTASFIDDKQLLLLAIVPAVYDIARGPRAASVADMIITVGAASALLGILQYGVLHYDNLGQRPQGTLTHYMTYSGVLMLALCAASAHAR